MDGAGSSSAVAMRSAVMRTAYVAPEYTSSAPFSAGIACVLSHHARLRCRLGRLHFRFVSQRVRGIGRRPRHSVRQVPSPYTGFRAPVPSDRGQLWRDVPYRLGEYADDGGAHPYRSGIGRFVRTCGFQVRRFRHAARHTFNSAMGRRRQPSLERVFELPCDRRMRSVSRRCGLEQARCARFERT